MRKHDQKIRTADEKWRPGTWIHYFRSQWVLTPIGKVSIPNAIRVPKMRSSKRQWLIWFVRFRPVIRIERLATKEGNEILLNNALSDYKGKKP